MKKIISFTGLAASIVWLGGLWCTILFLEQIGVTSEGYLSLFVGFGVQVILSFAQHTLWCNPKSKKVWGIAVGVVAFDTLTNFGGLFPYILRITATDSYKNIGILPSDPSYGIMVVVGLVVCFIVAALPELLITE